MPCHAIILTLYGAITRHEVLITSNLAAFSSAPFCSPGMNIHSVTQRPINESPLYVAKKDMLLKFFQKTVLPFPWHYEEETPTRTIWLVSVKETWVICWNNQLND